MRLEQNRGINNRYSRQRGYRHHPDLTVKSLEKEIPKSYEYLHQEGRGAAACPMLEQGGAGFWSTFKRNCKEDSKDCR